MGEKPSFLEAGPQENPVRPQAVETLPKSLLTIDEELKASQDSGSDGLVAKPEVEAEQQEGPNANSVASPWMNRSLMPCAVQEVSRRKVTTAWWQLWQTV